MKRGGGGGFNDIAQSEQTPGGSFGSRRFISTTAYDYTRTYGHLFKGACRKCVPSSSILTLNESIKQSPLTDITRDFARRKRIYSRIFPILSHVLRMERLDCRKLYPDKILNLKEAVFDDDYVRAAIELEKPSVEEQNDVFDRMKLKLKNSFRWWYNWLLFYIFRTLYPLGIIFNSGQLQVISHAQMHELPMILFPVYNQKHICRLDKLIPSFIFWNSGMIARQFRPVTFATTEESRKSVSSSSGFVLYPEITDFTWAVQHFVILRLLKAQQYLEVDPSSSYEEQIGFLMHLTEGLEEFGDALIVPVSLSFDWTGPKTIFNCIRRIFGSKLGYGSVTVEFEQPFSLKEFLDSQIIYFRIPEDDFESLSDLLRRHTLFSSSKQGRITPSQILSYIFLHYDDQIINDRGKLLDSFRALTKEITQRNREITFSRDFDSVLDYALEMLKSDVHFTGDGSFRIVNWSSLDFNSAFILYIFIPDSVLATSLMALLGRNRLNDVPLFVSWESLVETSKVLMHFLDGVYGPERSECSNLDEILSDAIDKFVVKEILELDDHHKRGGNRMFAGRPDIDDDDDDLEDYRPQQFMLVDSSVESVDRLRFLGRLIEPYLQCFYYVICLLEDFHDNNEDIFIKTVIEEIKVKMDTNGQKIPAECAEETMVKKCIKRLKRMEVISDFSPYLNDNSTKLQRLRSDIHRFI